MSHRHYVTVQLMANLVFLQSYAPGTLYFQLTTLHDQLTATDVCPGLCAGHPSVVSAYLCIGLAGLWHHLVEITHKVEL